jgi:hypothetical protein
MLNQTRLLWDRAPLVGRDRAIGMASLRLQLIDGDVRTIIELSSLRSCQETAERLEVVSAGNRANSQHGSRRA